MPSFIASVGVRVTRGRLPGSSTLNGFSAGSSTKLCMRWLMPIPVLPAMHAGFQPPDGVTETTQPSSSAASIEVVPAKKPSGTSWRLRGGIRRGLRRRPRASATAERRSVYGFFSS